LSRPARSRSIRSASSALARDDVNHLVNRAILVGGFGVLLLRTRLDAWPIFGVGVGFGAVTAIVWELLALGLTGSTLAALLAASVARRRG
jgi:hypothetical protein